jgi:hypothetical protein
LKRDCANIPVSPDNAIKVFRALTEADGYKTLMALSPLNFLRHNDLNRFAETTDVGIRTLYPGSGDD